ncbi:MAG: manganese efflux pump MntP family protein [bacterium]|nr:manganese efflux pump MntP family protein [bacterium]
MFVLTAIALGVALAMDAFSVSVVNGLNEPNMAKRKQVLMPLAFAIFQFLMPLVGYICVFELAEKFDAFAKAAPFIGFALLLIIGTKMIIEGVLKKDEDAVITSFPILLLQGIATSIDALSVGFAIENYSFLESIISCIIIGVLTFIICVLGVIIGKKIGDRFTSKTTIIGGIILIVIGVIILVKALI